MNLPVSDIGALIGVAGLSLATLRILILSSKKKLQQTELKKEVIKAAERQAQAYFRNRFWGLVAGTIPFDGTPLGFLAREIASIVAHIPLKTFTKQEIEEMGCEHGFKLYEAYEGLMQLNSEYPALFLQPEEQNNCVPMLQPEITELLGWSPLSPSRHNNRASIRLRQSFMAQLIRLRHQGLASVVEIIPPLHPDYAQLEWGELPKIYTRMMEMHLFPLLPAIPNAQRAVNELLTSRDPKLVAHAEQLQRELNEIVKKAYLTEVTSSFYGENAQLAQKNPATSVQTIRSLILEADEQLRLYAQ